MSVSYLILSHGRPEPVQRLAHRLVAGGSGMVYCHHDASWPALPQSRSPRVRRVRDRVAVRWGDFSVVEAVLRSLRWIEGNGAPFDWLVLLSGQDYPIASVAGFESFLERSHADGYIDHARATKRFAAENHDRYGFCYRPLPERLRPLASRARRINERQPWIRVLSTRAGCFLGLPDRRTFGQGFHPYRGSAWWALSRSCTDYLLAFTDRRPDVVAAYRRKLIPDESYVQTVLANAGFRLVSDDLHYIRWASEDAASPLVLTSEDLPALLLSGKWFARKFDDRRDPTIFARLDTLEGDERLPYLQAR